MPRTLESPIPEDQSFKSCFLKTKDVNKDEAVATLIYDEEYGPRLMIEAVNENNNKFTNIYSAKLVKSKVVIFSSEMDDEPEEDIEANSYFQSFLLTNDQLDDLITDIDSEIEEAMETESEDDELQKNTAKLIKNISSLVSGKIPTFFNVANTEKADVKAQRQKLKEHLSAFDTFKNLLDETLDTDLADGLEEFKKKAFRYESSKKYAHRM